MDSLRDINVAYTAQTSSEDGRRRRLTEIFVLGSAVVGVAGAMPVTLDGRFTPGSYNPLGFGAEHSLHQRLLQVLHQPAVARPILRPLAAPSAVRP